MTEPYDLRSNIKGKPGSQGTLFQVKDKGLLNPQQRWPRGYTPERLSEVRDATSTIPVSPPGHIYGTTEDEAVRKHGVGVGGYRERLNRTLAKTTVPPEDLERLTAIHGQPAEGHAASYWPGKRQIGVDLTSEHADKDLIHEVGHHHDETNHVRQRYMSVAVTQNAIADRRSRGEEGIPNSTEVAYARNRVSPGVGEAVADNYLTKHYRTGGRKSAPVTQGRYEENFEPKVLDKRYPGYSYVRPQKQFSDNLSKGQFQGTLF
jgi:hypothetical protein